MNMHASGGVMVDRNSDAITLAKAGREAEMPAVQLHENGQGLARMTDTAGQIRVSRDESNVMSRRFSKMTWLYFAGALIALALLYVDHPMEHPGHYHASRLVRLLAKVL